MASAQAWPGDPVCHRPFLTAQGPCVWMECLGVHKGTHNSRNCTSLRRLALVCGGNVMVPPNTTNKGKRTCSPAVGAGSLAPGDTEARQPFLPGQTEEWCGVPAGPGHSAQRTRPPYSHTLWPRLTLDTWRRTVLPPIASDLSDFKSGHSSHGLSNSASLPHSTAPTPSSSEPHLAPLAPLPGTSCTLLPAGRPTPCQASTCTP